MTDPWLNPDANQNALQTLANLGITGVSYQSGTYGGIGTYAGSPTGEVQVALDNNPTTFLDDDYSGPKPLVLVGNDAGDYFDVERDTGVSIIDGAGNDTVRANSSEINLVTSTGNVDVEASGNDTINHTDPLGDGGRVTINLFDGSTLHLGTTNGNDTVNALGSATVYGGDGDFVFQGANGASANVYAGAGAETLYGGSGVGTTTNFFGGKGPDLMVGGNDDATNNLYAGSGPDTLVGGTNATNTFFAGTGHDTMVAGQYGKDLQNVFEFQSSVGGGSTVIQDATNQGFASATDQIVLQGYTQSSINSWFVSGGNTYISLNDGTSIKLSGVTIQENQALTNHWITFK